MEGSLMKLQRIAALALGLVGMAPARPPIDAVQCGSREFNRFLFFAVLEGLYEDGVSQPVVDRILERDKPPGRYANFVYSCPICSPVVDAFRAFSRRHESHTGWKDADSAYLGSSIPGEIARSLADPDVEVFR